MLQGKYIFACFHDSQLDESPQVEVDRTLRAVLESEKQRFGKDPAQIALLAHCLTILWFLKGDSLQVSCFTRYDAMTQFPICSLFCLRIGLSVIGEVVDIRWGLVVVHRPVTTLTCSFHFLPSVKL